LLSDAITSLPPIDSDETSLSTYWIDRARREVLRRREAGDDGPVQSGNATTLVLSGSTVIATSDYELFDDEPMSVDEFLDILRQWRDEVIAGKAQPASSDPADLSAQSVPELGPRSSGSSPAWTPSTVRGR
jgi:hypothetical protein